MRKFLKSDIKPEMHYVTIFYNIFLSFNSELTGFPAGSFRTIRYKIIIADNLRFNKTLFKICMYHTGCLRSFPSFMNSPGADFLNTSCKIGSEVQKFIS